MTIERDESEYIADGGLDSQALLGRNSGAVPNPEGILTTDEDRELGRIVIPVCLDIPKYRKKFSEIHDQSGASHLKTYKFKESEQELIMNAFRRFNEDSRINQKYRFAIFSGRELSSVQLGNHVFNNLICVSKVKKGALGGNVKAKSWIRYFESDVAGEENINRVLMDFDAEIFKNPHFMENLIAHEIGHAAFHLKHATRLQEHDAPPFWPLAQARNPANSIMVTGDSTLSECVALKTSEYATANDLIGKSSRFTPREQGGLKVEIDITRPYEAESCYRELPKIPTDIDIEAISLQHERAHEDYMAGTGECLQNSEGECVVGEFEDLAATIPPAPPIDVNTNRPTICVTKGNLRGSSYTEGEVDLELGREDSLVAECSPKTQDRSAEQRAAQGFLGGLFSRMLSDTLAYCCPYLKPETRDLAITGLSIAIYNTNPQVALALTVGDLSLRYFAEPQGARLLANSVNNYFRGDLEQSHIDRIVETAINSASYIIGERTSQIVSARVGSLLEEQAALNLV